MNANDKGVLNLTDTFVRCRACWERPELARALTDEWYPPRGWAGRGPDGTREVMLVALNPGKPMNSERVALQNHGLILPRMPTPAPDRTTKEHSRLVWDLAAKHYEDRNAGGDSIFHKKSLSYALLALALIDNGKVSTPADALRRCWFTDAYKCSIHKESGPAITKPALRLCGEHFWAELRYFKPRVVLALGGRAKWAVETILARQPAGKRPAMVALRHPSNGCPKLHGGKLNAPLEELGRVLRSEVLNDSVSFLALRRQIHEQLFPPLRPRPRPGSVTDVTGVTRSPSTVAQGNKT